MASKYLSYSGLQTFWAKIKANFLNLSGGTVNGNITANKFIKSGATANDVLLGNGSTKSVSTFMTTDKLYQMPTNAFGGSTGSIHQNLTNDGMYAASKRFNVTLTGFTTTVSDNLFDGNYETVCQISAGGTGIILIEAPTGSTLFGSYNYGYTIISFYYTSIPESVSMRIYGTRSAGTNWYPANAATYYYGSSTSTNNVAMSIYNSSTYSATKFEITIVAKTDIACKVTQVDHMFTRGATSMMSAVTKFPVTQGLWGDVVAPKFIVRNGTSSQFLKADGTLDSNEYINSSDEITTAWINSNCV